jgi:hypothetical protein
MGGTEVVSLEVLSEWGTIDEDDSIFDDGLGSDELIIGGVVENIKNLGLSGAVLWLPGEVTVIESEGSEFVVTTSNSDSSNGLLVSVVGKLGVGRWPSTLEESLLLVDGHSTTRQSSLMSWISRNTHRFGREFASFINILEI